MVVSLSKVLRFSVNRVGPADQAPLPFGMSLYGLSIVASVWTSPALCRGFLRLPQDIRKYLKRKRKRLNFGLHRPLRSVVFAPILAEMP
jgi:hypothetical protein